jgi:hypothetical protein
MEQQQVNPTAQIPEPNAATITRALRLLENQRKAARAYYLRNRDTIKARTARYWEEHREELNQRRRQRYEEQKGVVATPPQQTSPS